ncbi:PAS domain-containing protein [Dongia deserti]|uniref:PAS domain-containing protein n=1 Tax=Dongia deserti TaxID=2268030 RepID=UPI0013C3EBC9|nr:PAS domain-containing protein [Dongia deserti]
MAVYKNPEDVRSDLVRFMHHWWLSKCRGDIPDRRDLDPADIKPLLPTILISDVEHDPFRIRYRLVGTRAREATGFNIVGRYLDELLPTDPDEPWMDDYALAYRTRCPVLGVSSVKKTSGGIFTYEFGLFPLRNGGIAIDQFVAVEDYGDLRSTLMDLIEWRERERDE